jgi:hypothetical protein
MSLRLEKIDAEASQKEHKSVILNLALKQVMSS